MGSLEQVGRFARMAARVCVVVGVGPGLGMSCVRQWAKEGYKVAMVSRTASKLEAASAENPGTLAVAADVTNPASLTAALTTVEQKLGEIHTAALRGKPMTVGFATAKAAQRMLTQSLARDLGPKGIHCFYVIVDGGIGRQSGDQGENGSRMDPDAIAADYWHVANQPKNNWTQELDCRPWVENW